MTTTDHLPERATASSTLAIRSDQSAWTPEQRHALAQLGCEDASDTELAVFFHQSVRTGLDPFAKQIYLVGRYDKRAGRKVHTIQTGIDGYRLIAMRTGKYDGADGPFFCGPDGVWSDVWLGSTPPAAAKVTVFRKDAARGFTAVAMWTEYAQVNQQGQPTAMWARMPGVMLAKCAEALALRKAFPQDLSGIYTAEEMSQADSESVIHIPATTPAPSVPEGMVDRSSAVTQLIAVCDGDSARAQKLWGEAGLPGRDAQWVDAVAFEDLITLATPIEDDDVIDAEVVDGEDA